MMDPRIFDSLLFAILFELVIIFSFIIIGVFHYYKDIFDFSFHEIVVTFIVKIFVSVVEKLDKFVPALVEKIVVSIKDLAPALIERIITSFKDWVY